MVRRTDLRRAMLASAMLAEAALPLRLVAALALVVALAMPAAAQPMRTEIMDGSVRTLRVAPEHNIYFPPVLVLGSDDRLRVEFDGLGDDVRYLRYSLTHCNADWQPSALLESEYTDGFNYADIEDCEFSATTFTHYVHYRFSVPNEQMGILRSGNYVVRVYERDDPERTLLQARFCVCENLAMVSGTVTTGTDIDYNDTHQQISVVARPRQGVVRDPYNDLKLYVNQNSRLDNEVVVTKPLLVSGSAVCYDHDRALIFDAGNEYRRVETVAVNEPSMGVESVRYFHPYYHATLRTDAVRAGEPYYYDRTQQGRFTVRNRDSDGRSDVEADYMVTHFSLDAGGELAGGQIYVDGQFTGGRFDGVNRMRYDAATGLYLCDMLLKQGAYNYQYLWVPDGSDRPQTARIEGDKYQTVNEYLLRLYLRSPADRYDRFIGFGICFSGR